ncbi:uncharacterized protein A1O9_08848 [Exophiala aquamarina CBS 119918]|uniref:Alcohol dehydrogenase n=1 Tax=Exophiala aquamarina CBS 119918 TaxID=1182545 RepID=A0A072P504_9EURO|nr:uncharacterized protein A1O9_08848 [Exophiala aquamarina CBS 119918]KEF55194.1 hypothetical protein A1O9_08848 [Exophiala aquamarina CBS 119918]
MSTTYLISGANRGIGYGLAGLILARPNTTLVALVRDPEHETSKSLHALAKAEHARVIVLAYEAMDPDSAATAIATAQHTHGVDHIDILIANAGGMSWRGPTVSVPASEIHNAISLNTLSPLHLFRAAVHLLRAPSPSRDGPAKFFAISSGTSSISLLPTMPYATTVPYGLSKAALNYLIRKLSTEYTDIVIELLTPGPVKTDLTRAFPDLKDLMKRPEFANRLVDIDKSVAGLLECVDSARFKSDGDEGTHGGFRDYSGATVPW